MPWLIGIAIAIFLIVKFWQYLLATAAAVVALWIAVVLIKKAHLEAKNAEAARTRARLEKEEAAAAYKAAQETCQSELIEISQLSLHTFENLPKHLLKAEALLNQAEADFNEGAFAPFWDSIEQATLSLGRFDGAVIHLNQDSKRFQNLANSLDSEPPRFPIVDSSVKAMVAANTTAERLKNIVRRAQRNYEFASIYQQRRTNQILIAGFTNLAQAVDGLGQRISESIDDLSGQIGQMSEAISDSIESLSDRMTTANVATIEAAQKLQSTLENRFHERTERHDRALQMLDNIQRRRMPAGFHWDVGTKPAP